MEVSRTMFYGKVNYKYLLKQDLVVQTSIKGAAAEVLGFIYLSQDGLLTVKAGYAWDGPSGPTWDTDDFMAGSCVHDAFYQLMRMRKLGQEWRKAADQELVKLCEQAGMSWFRRRYVYAGLREFAGYAARPGKDVIYEVQV